MTFLVPFLNLLQVIVWHFDHMLRQLPKMHSIPSSGGPKTGLGAFGGPNFVVDPPVCNVEEVGLMVAVGKVFHDMLD